MKTSCSAHLPRTTSYLHILRLFCRSHRVITVSRVWYKHPKVHYSGKCSVKLTAVSGNTSGSWKSRSFVKDLVKDGLHWRRLMAIEEEKVKTGDELWCNEMNRRKMWPVYCTLGALCENMGDWIREMNRTEWRGQCGIHSIVPFSIVVSP